MLTSKTVEQEQKDEVAVGDQSPLSWEEFEKEYLSREDEFKYEWANGRVVKTKRNMNQHQYFILKNIERFFLQLKKTGKATGELMTEIDTFFLENALRRPDMAWFSEEQAARMAYRQNQVPNFIIEIVSDNDNADKLLDKLSDYANAHVEVIWLISPKLEQVHVYAGTNRGVFKGDMICDASPVLPEFKISANDIFKKPALPTA